MKQERIPIALEGYPFIGYSVLLTILSALLGYPIITLVLLVAATFILMFFRDPERTTPDIEGGVISPADGKIIFVETTRDERFSEDKLLKISIFMNVFNVHVNRIPITASVTEVRHVPGSFLAADSEKAHLNNEYCAVEMITPDRRKITMVQIAGLVARRIICRLEAGDDVSCGKRFGMIRFGSRVDLYLPHQSNPAVKVGDKVVAGESLLAYLG
jgi:phosphatidylserine decarboxylase